MNLRILEVDLFRSECRTRLPFRFGSTVMRAATLLVAKVRVLGVDGREVCGYSSDLLVPKWFRKKSEQSAEADAEELIQSAQVAAAVFGDSELGFLRPFDLWWAGYRQTVQSLAEDADDLLVRGFGMALIERAMLDAACRAADKSFFAALKSDLFGFRPGEGRWCMNRRVEAIKGPDSGHVGGGGPRSRHEVESASEVQDEVPSRQLA